jgi:peptidoglycan/xylan/chitin deacetylase (PgdA/CDA1 family)
MSSTAPARIVPLLATALLAVSASESPAQTRAVAVTVDDLPHVGGSGTLSEARRVTSAMTEVLERRRVPASGFVTGKRVLVAGQVEERLELLREWVRAGTTLENHSYSHESFHRVPAWRHRDDVVRGQLLPSRIAAEFGDTVRFYRHPFNHAGETLAIRERFAEFLARRDLEVAPFTVEHADYLYNRLYVAARAAGDTAGMRRVGRAYLDQLDRGFAFAEELAAETFDRPIPQVFLIHANGINADYLARMLDRLEARGYRFVSLAEAVEDPAYASPDGYSGTAGVSWLHRWREGLGLEDRLRDEPDPPAWALEAYRELGS